MKNTNSRFYVKVDILAELKRKGYSQLRLREEKLMWPTEITRLRSGEIPSWGLLEKVCDLTGLCLSDIIGDRGGSEKPMFVERVDEHGNEVYTLNPAADGDSNEHEQDDAGGGRYTLVIPEPKEHEKQNIVFRGGVDHNERKRKYRWTREGGFTGDDGANGDET